MNSPSGSVLAASFPANSAGSSSTEKRIEEKNPCSINDWIQFLHESTNYSDRDINIVCTYFNKTEHKILTTSLSISYVKLSEKILHFKNVPKTFNVWRLD